MCVKKQRSQTKNTFTGESRFFSVISGCSFNIVAAGSGKRNFASKKKHNGNESERLLNIKFVVVPKKVCHINKVCDIKKVLKIWRGNFCKL